MIEQFSEEQLEQIKRELGLLKVGGCKKSICNRQYARIVRLFDKCKETKRGVYPTKKVWESLCVICDISLMNYVNSTSSKNGGNDLKRYSSIFNKVSYRNMLNELLDVIEKYRNESEEQK